MRFQYLNHVLRIRCCRKGRRRHAAPLKSRTLISINFLLHNYLILLNTIPESAISSFAAHLPFLLCVPTFAFPEPQSACALCSRTNNIGIGVVMPSSEQHPTPWDRAKVTPPSTPNRGRGFPGLQGARRAAQQHEDRPHRPG